jgi:hypothetical protein
MIVLVALKVPASSLDLQKSEKPLVYLNLKKLGRFKKCKTKVVVKLTAFYTHIPQGIEQSRLANIWHTDDKDVELHGMGIFLGYVCKETIMSF